MSRKKVERKPIELVPLFGTEQRNRSRKYDLSMLDEHDLYVHYLREEGFLKPTKKTTGKYTEGYVDKCKRHHLDPYSPITQFIFNGDVNSSRKTSGQLDTVRLVSRKKHGSVGYTAVDI